MRILGLDLGSKTLGVSVSDALGMIARPVETIRFESDDYDAAFEQVQKYHGRNVRRSLIRWRLYKFCRAILTVRTRGLKEPLYRRKKRCWIQAVCM